MIGLGAFAERFRPAASAAAQPVAEHPAPIKASSAIAALLPPLNRSWERTMSKIDEQITDAQDRRAALVAEIEPLTLAHIEGDDEAGKKVDAIERQIEDVDRELSRLSMAHRKAAERLQAEDVARAAKALKERKKDGRIAAADLAESAAKVDEAVAALAEALNIYQEAGHRVGDAIGRGTDEASAILRRLTLLPPAVVSYELRAATGYSFPMSVPSFGRDPMYWRRLSAGHHLVDGDEVARQVERVAAKEAKKKAVAA